MSNCIFKYKKKYIMSYIRLQKFEQVGYNRRNRQLIGVYSILWCNCILSAIYLKHYFNRNHCSYYITLRLDSKVLKTLEVFTSPKI